MELTQSTAISQGDKNNKLSTWPRSLALTLMQNIQNILYTMFSFIKGENSFSCHSDKKENMAQRL